jgi:homogentisate 1,2-dioxygenase
MRTNEPEAGKDTGPQSLRAPAHLVTQPGFGGTHDSEALPGALPRGQNAPRLCPYGLVAELVNGTPFTVRNAENSRVWLYRVRATFSHGPFVELPHAAFLSPLRGVTPNRTRWRPMPIPADPARVDFVDGLATLGGAGEPTGLGYLVHLYAANADMVDRAFSSADGDLLLVPQTGTLECRTELGWLRVPPGSVAIIPRGIRFAIGLPEGEGRGWMLEVTGKRLRLPERGPIGSNGLADARHFLAPTASYEDRTCPAGFQLVTKLGGRLFAATQAHSPFDVVAWHGVHVPYAYDLAMFSPMGSVKFDHPDPSILTVLTAPLDDHGRALADFVVFPGRWDVLEHSFRPPFMHRNAASEINGVITTPHPQNGYDPGCTFLTPLLTPHGVATKTYDAIWGMTEEKAEGPHRLPDASVWMMFESALPFCPTEWAAGSPLVDDTFHAMFEGMRSRFDPSRP